MKQNYSTILITLVLCLFISMNQAIAQCPVGPDKDNDGVPDIVDVDDDNDGILDVDECTSSDWGSSPWDWPSGAFDNTIAVNNSLTMNLNVTTAADGDLLVDYDAPGANMGGIADLRVRFNPTAGQGTSPVNVVITFSAPVDGLSFVITDLDGAGGRQDKVTVTSDAGNPTLTVVSTNPTFTVTGNTAQNNDGSSGSVNNDRGTALATFPDGVTTVTILYEEIGGQNNPQARGIGILGELIFCGDTDGDGIADAEDLDSDNDGIPDAVEACGDISLTLESCSLDWDGSASYPDNDVDGCPDGLVSTACSTTPVDTDNDGTPDFLDLDSDGDGCADNVEAGTSGLGTSGDTYIPGSVDACGLLTSGISGTCPVPANSNWTDDTVTGDVCDIDDDNDGIPDVVELCGPGAVDFSCLPGGSDPGGDDDGDGIPNYNDADYCFLNEQGVCDDMDSDGDGTPDHLDLDADNDGIPDVIEAGGNDPDGDGIVGTGTPTDSDGDGLPDAADPDGTSPTNTGTPGDTNLPAPDTDSDGIPDFKDLDADNDGIADIVEVGGTDSNGDGYVDDYDPAAPNGTDPWGGTNPDNDGWSNTYDGDSNNDGTIDTPNNWLVEDCVTCTNPTNMAINPDATNGLNHLDLDSDDDGCSDTVEAGFSDGNGDGVIGATTPITDTDEDGWSDIADPDNGGTPSPDSGDAYDAAVVGSICDIDDDNDGIPDVVELCGPGAVDFSCLPGGSDPGGDDDGDGIPNYNDADYCFLNEQGVCDDMDNDGDGIPNHLDLDADNDGIPDVIEAGGSDPDNDGIAGTGPPTDSDGDGLPDAADPDGSSPTNTGDPSQTTYPITSTDGDGIPDYLDLDSDDDGIPDLIEVGGTDADGDGMADSETCVIPFQSACTVCPQDDADNNGWADVYDSGTPLVNDCLTAACDPSIHADGDGTANHLDGDSDDDGCSDTVEAGGYDQDGDLVIGGTGSTIDDGDADGWSDIVDCDAGGTVMPYNDLNTAGGPIDAYDGTSSCADIEGSVWGDDDRSDGYDGTEPDLVGIKIYLQDDMGNVIDSTLTLADGSYSFDNIPSGDYNIIVDTADPDPNYPDLGTPGTIPVTLTPGGASLGNNFGFDPEPNLSIEIESFTAELMKCSANLKWVTNAENGVILFEVQRSLDGIRFESIGTVEAEGNDQSGTFTYEFVDHALPAEAYYRLKIVEVDEAIYFSDLIVLASDCPVGIEYHSIYPNPATSHLTFDFHSIKDGDLRLSMMDMYGRIVLTENLTIAKGGNSKTMNITGLAAGVYSIRIESEGKFSPVGKFVKLH